MMRGKILNRTKGITLIALVVTIVVLLILAGITLTYVFGDNGIIKLAQEAKNRTDDAIKNEQEDFGEMVNLLKNEYNGGSGSGNSEDGSGSGNGNNEGGGGNTTDPVDPPTPGGSTIVDIIDEIQKDTITVEDANKNPITIPGGFKVVPNSPEGADASERVDYTYNGDGTPAVQDGIVIEDAERNQFVWIPVGTIKNKDNTTTTITLGRYTFDYYNGTPALQQDADNYSKPVTIGGYYQELTSDSGNKAAKNLKDFVTNTKANGGYYLGRYEASKGEDGKVKSQFNKTVWEYINQPTAATNCQNMYQGDSFVESDLINSYSWDTAIVFIQKYSESNNYANKKSVNKNSTEKTGRAGDKVCNIHDMASNDQEWTTEHSTNRDATRQYCCVNRGGYAYHLGHATADRFDSHAGEAWSGGTFRPLIYLKNRPESP